MTDAFIVSAVRTPIGRAGGALAGVRSDDLAALAVGAAVERGCFPAERIDDVILGCANQAGEDNRNVARMAVLLAGLPIEVPAQTINRLCGSGLQALASAAQAIKAGEGHLFVAGGVESMTRSPYVTLKSGTAWDRATPQVADTTLGWRFINPRMPADWTITLGQTAERVAQLHGVTREDQDAFAAESQRKAQAAIAAGHFADELVPVPVPGPVPFVTADEHPRAGVTAEGLARLSPAFAKAGTATAGNSSGINDGASALGVASTDAVREHRLVPMARILGTAVAGVDPSCMGLGPIPATQKLLARLGMSVADIDLVELNEAFAAQAVPCIRELGLDPTRVNVSGGAIALGHPLGASGARMVTTLVHALRRTGGRYGLATMCIGVGQGIAMVVERTE